MAKKVDKSPYHKEGVDPVTELHLGEGAIRLEECRIVINGGRTVDVGEHTINKLTIFGVALSEKDMVCGDRESQMWECDIIVIPRKKYRKGFHGWRADQILCDKFAEPDKWEEEIFSK